MKTILIGINAKYIHTNLAIRYLKEYTKIQKGIEIETEEYTINQQLNHILSEIYKKKPDIIGLSCYIWNFEMVKVLCCELKKLLPNLKIILGGPEVSFNPTEVLKATNSDFIIMGEGEDTFAQLIEALTNNYKYNDIKGIAYKEDGKIIENQPQIPLDMSTIPFVYDNYDELKHKIVYYESSRGCPFNCQYCLSGSKGGVRFLPIERVFKDLKHFLDAKVRQVKFVDRTFNCDKSYAMAIWKFLMENDNGITNFHFEIAAELIDDEIIGFLKDARKGLFQFEIGVQSTNKETLKAIKRVTLPEKLTPIINGLKSGKNIHLHLDLIAGLPFEGYDRFKNSFNYVCSLVPDQLQLGFLKLLKGSGLYDKREEYGLIHTDFAPYEILKTNWLSYDDVLRLKMIEEMVELYYNSNRYKQALSYILSLYDNPFEFFESLALYYENNGYHLSPHGKLDYYNFLYEFSKDIKSVDLDILEKKLTFDIFSHEKINNLPYWTKSENSKYKKEIFDFIENRENIEKYLKEYQEFDTKQILRQAHIEVFNLNPITNQNEQTAILFNYKSLDILGNADYYIVEI